MSERGTTRRELAALAGAGALAALVDGAVTPRSAAARLFRGMPADMIQLNANESPYGPSAAARAAMAASFDVACRYPGDREEELRETLAAAHRVRAEQVVLGCGSGEILRMADHAFLGPDRAAVVAEPTFEAVLAYAAPVRAEVVKVPLTSDFRHDLPRMAAACATGVGMVYVCNPNNPTGTVVTRAELAAFLKVVPHAVTVLLDEAYLHFVERDDVGSGFDLLAEHDNLVVLRTFSKVYGLAGMRLGYAVASPARAEALKRRALFNDANAAVLAAALASLAEPELVPRVRKALNDARRALCAELERDGRRVIPSEANFVMLETGADVADLVAAFARRKILVGRRFAAMPTWLRVTVGTAAEMAAFLAALRELCPAPAARPT